MSWKPGKKFFGTPYSQLNFHDRFSSHRSAGEASIFEEAIYKRSKEFDIIKRDYLPWKSMRSIIEYFFMWKTTDRYVQMKRIKAQDSENKLKQVRNSNCNKLLTQY